MRDALSLAETTDRATALENQSHSTSRTGESMAMKRHCDRCGDETGERDYYVVTLTRHDKKFGNPIERTEQTTELCEGCGVSIKRDINTAPARPMAVSA